MSAPYKVSFNPVMMFPADYQPGASEAYAHYATLESFVDSNFAALRNIEPRELGTTAGGENRITHEEIAASIEPDLGEFNLKLASSGEHIYCLIGERTIWYENIALKNADDSDVLIDIPGSNELPRLGLMLEIEKTP